MDTELDIRPHHTRHHSASHLPPAKTSALLSDSVALTERAAAMLRAYLDTAGLRGYRVFASPNFDLEDVDRLLAQIEPDGKGMPVLLRQYLKLNAQALAFSVDPEFGDALDALMMVDLAVVEPAILNRYLGRQQAAAFLSPDTVPTPATDARREPPP